MKILQHLHKRVFLLAVITLALCPALWAQGKQEKVTSPTSVAHRLGLKTDALTVRDTPQPYQANPVDGDSSPVNSSASNVSAGPDPVAGRPNIHGTLSVQNFQGTQQNLSQTHASADGFRAYLESFYPANFAGRDSSVSAWWFNDIANGDNYDVWTSEGIDWGIDAVRILWHSSHGITSNNVYYTSLGGNWASRGWDAVSTKMALGGNNNNFGDEYLRYLFWDTCQSVKISGGNSPSSTWAPRAKGIRIIFGYETDSVDSEKYGSAFWTEWNKGKSFSTAFLDASWYHVSTKQSPSVVAFGENRDDAKNRVDNERSFYREAAKSDWAAWRWYTARSFAPDVSLQYLSLPLQVKAQSVVKRGNSDQEIGELARSLGLRLVNSQTIQDRPQGLRAVTGKGLTLVVEPNGNFEMSVEADTSKASLDEPLSEEKMATQALEIAEQINKSTAQNARVAAIRDLNENEGTADFQSLSRVTERTIIIDQVIDDLAFTDPDAGHLTVTFNVRSGQIVRVHSSWQTPAGELKSAAPQKQLYHSIAEARSAALKSLSNADGSPTPLEIVADSESVGYSLQNGKAIPVYRALLRNPNFTSGRLQQVILPLVKID